MSEAKTARQSRKSAKDKECDEAREQLRKILRPGNRVYCVLRHVSRSGMQRVIDLQVVTTLDDGQPWLRTIGSLAAKATGAKYDYRRGGIVMNGCGSDMGWEAVYHLAYSLWPAGYGCIGEKCPSNDHSNGDRDYTPHGTLVNPHALTAEEIARELAGEEVRVHHWHRDGGYALKHEWV